MFDLIVQFLSQVGGGPGAPENNLVRFALPAIFWTILFFVAWSRQRSEHLPRERLLVFGFALAASRDLLMFLHTAEHMLRGPTASTDASFVEPFEHALTVLAVLLICAAYIRFILDDEALSRRFLVVGLVAIGFGLLISFTTWPSLQAANPGLHFRSTVGGWTMQLTMALIIVAGIVILSRSNGWVRNIVIAALVLLLSSVVLALVNTASGRAYDAILCPVGNNLYIWSVPLFGYVYFREQGLARRKAEASLAVYRSDLEQLVESRTSDLWASKREAETWASVMSRLHEASLLFDTTLEPDEIGRLIVTQATHLLACDMACLFRVDGVSQTAVFVTSFGATCPWAAGTQVPVLENPTLRELLSHREPLVIDDARADARADLAGLQPGQIKALLGVPLLGSSQVTGLLLAIELSEARSWQPYEVKLFQNFAARASLAWENAILHVQLRRAATLEERQRIAAEMHDGLAQTISLLALRNDQVAEMVEKRRFQPALAELTEIQGVITLAGRDLRRSIAGLASDPQPPSSLQDALDELVQDNLQGQCSQIWVESEVDTPIQLPQDQLDQIIHIVREALLNACRHAQAETVTVRLSANGAGWGVVIQDDGQGFCPDRVTTHAGDHFGLSIMQARAQRMGADLAVTTEIGRGTQIALTWPREEGATVSHSRNGTLASGIIVTEPSLVKAASPCPD